MSGLLNIIIPILAVYLVYRLYTTLGKDDDNGQDMDQNRRMRDQHRQNYERLNEENNNNVINLPTANDRDKNGPQQDPVEMLANAMDSENFADATDEAKRGLKSIIEAYPNFDYRQFLNGSERAYEMINLAFAQNDRDVLERLLTPEVYESFEGVMKAREAAGQRINSRFVGIEKLEVMDAQKSANIVTLTVHFNAKLISTTYDKNDVIIEGSESHIYNTNDLWSFETDMNDENTSWKLSATAKA